MLPHACESRETSRGQNDLSRVAFGHFGDFTTELFLYLTDD